MKRLLICTLLSMIFSACTHDNIDQAYSPSDKPEYIYASIDGGETTRVELNSNKQSVWSKEDKIVRLGNNIFDVWSFTGNTGDRSGSFAPTGLAGSLDYAFGDKYYAFYPYDHFISLAQFANNDLAFCYYVTDVLNYQYKSYDPLSNAMHGIGSDAENFKFKNLMGYLRLSLTGNKKVSYIALSGKNNEVLGGRRYVHQEDIDINGWFESDEYPNTYTKYINCGDMGIQLTDTPTEFYFTLVPTTFENGIYVEVYFTDGSVYPINTSKRIEITRNTIQPMATINTGENSGWQTITIKHHGDIVSAPYLLGGSALTGYIYWGDGYMSDINTVESYIYSDGTHDHEITVKSINANYLYIKSCAGISELDLSNF